jgi:hypothetical protein
MPFKSKKQWRWAFANKKAFARKWAHQTKSYKRLPAKKRRKRR